MIGLDTTVLARYYLEDDADAEAQRQRLAARRLMESGQSLMVCKTVILELEWVMRGYRGFAPAQAASVLRHLLDLPHVTVEDRSTVEQALSNCDAEIDFADALHRVTARFASPSRSATKSCPERRPCRRAWGHRGGWRLAVAARGSNYNLLAKWLERCVERRRSALHRIFGRSLGRPMRAAGTGFTSGRQAPSAGLSPPLSGRASGRSPLAKVRLEWLVSAHLGTQTRR